MAKQSKADRALANIRAQMEPLQQQLNGLRLAELALIDARDEVPGPAPKRGRKAGTRKAKDAAVTAEAGAQS